MTTTPCEGCEHIAAEYREAVIDFWAHANQDTRASCQAMTKLMSHGEAAQAQLRPFTPEELKRSPTPLQARIQKAMFHKTLHQQKTGHTVNLFGKRLQ
jgi:hypothetical protein